MARTNVAYTNVTVTVEICSRCSQEPMFKVSSLTAEILLTLSLCGWGGWCRVILLSNPTIVLRLGWGFDNNLFKDKLIFEVTEDLKLG